MESAKRRSTIENELVDNTLHFEHKSYTLIKLVNNHTCVVCKCPVHGPALAIGSSVNGVCHNNCLQFLDLRNQWHHEKLAVNYLESEMPSASLPIPIPEPLYDEHQPSSPNYGPLGGFASR